MSGDNALDLEVAYFQTHGGHSSMRQRNSGRLTKKYGDVAVSILEKHVQLAVDRCLKPVVVILSNRSNKGIETS